MVPRPQPSPGHDPDMRFMDEAVDFLILVYPFPTWSPWTLEDSLMGGQEVVPSPQHLVRCALLD